MATNSIEDLFANPEKKNRISVKILATKNRRCIIADSTRSCQLKIDAGCPDSILAKFFTVGSCVKMTNIQVKKELDLLVLQPKSSVFKQKQLLNVVTVNDLELPEEEPEPEEVDEDGQNGQDLADEKLCADPIPLAETLKMRPHKVSCICNLLNYIFQFV